MRRVDFAYPEIKLAIEADSVRHHTGREAVQRDVEQRRELISLGWTVVVITDQDLRHRRDRLRSEVEATYWRLASFA